MKQPMYIYRCTNCKYEIEVSFISSAKECPSCLHRMVFAGMSKPTKES